MADDPLRDLITDMRADIREDLAGIRVELGRLVPREVYELGTEALKTANAVLAARVVALEQGRVEDQKKAAADQAAAEKERRSLRRFVLGSVIVPIAAVVLTYLLMRGGA